MPSRVTIVNYDAALRQHYHRQRRSNRPRAPENLPPPFITRRIEHYSDSQENDISPSESASQLPKNRERRQRTPHRVSNLTPRPVDRHPVSDVSSLQHDSRSVVPTSSSSGQSSHVVSPSHDHQVLPAVSAEPVQAKSTQLLKESGNSKFKALSAYAATVESISESSSTKIRNSDRPRLIEVSYRHTVHYQTCRGNAESPQASSISAEPGKLPSKAASPSPAAVPIAIDETCGREAHSTTKADRIFVEAETPSVVTVQSDSDSDSRIPCRSGKHAPDYSKHTMTGPRAADMEAKSLTVEAVKSLEHANEEHMESITKSAVDSAIGDVRTVLPAQSPSLGKEEAPVLQGVTFVDAVNRKFEFPFASCNTWKSMESLVQQTFRFVEVVSHRVMLGHYDLIGPGDSIILPSVWDATINPGWKIRMSLWPVPDIVELATKSVSGAIVMSEHVPSVSGIPGSVTHTNAKEMSACNTVVSNPVETSGNSAAHTAGHSSFVKGKTQPFESSDIADNAGTIKSIRSAAQSHETDLKAPPTRSKSHFSTPEPSTVKAPSITLKTCKPKASVKVQQNIHVYVSTDREKSPSIKAASASQKSTALPSNDSKGASVKSSTPNIAAMEKDGSVEPASDNVKGAADEIRDKVVQSDIKPAPEAWTIHPSKTGSALNITKKMTGSEHSSRKSRKTASKSHSHGAKESAVPAIVIEAPTDPTELVGTQAGAEANRAASVVSGSNVRRVSSNEAPNSVKTSASRAGSKKNSKSVSHHVEEIPRTAPAEAESVAATDKNKTATILASQNGKKSKGEVSPDGIGTSMTVKADDNDTNPNQAVLAEATGSKPTSLHASLKSQKSAKTKSSSKAVVHGVTGAPSRAEPEGVADLVKPGESAGGSATRDQGAAVVEENYKAFRRRRVEVPPYTAWLVGNTHYGPGFPSRR